MKDKIKLILEIIKMGKAIFREYKKVKDTKSRKNILEIVEKTNSKAFRKSLFGKK